ncbi:PTS system mannitol-specific transsporter subunit IIA [Gracilibacillus halophilus YIM-C55.5]|uniref:Mannitol-specific phosphotransferase enzyme IIA component n=1 Tax=Gracilibacillus halophilus YIM-C55.5 TaxID=1308866 RepID=N4WUZ9_9BACI|nr:PTS sugar transporter subunit IIA [Gracilibacillus halophilus]ENH98170.1 PTS system mannitol-specific transsporter subunit IIA [Gracilibacillus halophilus YIM-C55.5]
MAKDMLTSENIELGVALETKEEAIQYVGNLLQKNGYVEDTYVDKMLEREEVTSTYIGNQVAIPHGTEDAKQAVNETGLAVVTVPEGVDFGGNSTHIIIGIAGKGDEHLEILSNIALVCADEANIEKMKQADSKEAILDILGGVQ